MTSYISEALVACIVFMGLEGCTGDCPPDPVIATANYQIVGGTRPDLIGAIVGVTDWGLVVMWSDAYGPHAGAYEYGGGDYHDSGDTSDSGSGRAK